MFQNICGSGLFRVHLFCKRLFEYLSLQQIRHFDTWLRHKSVTSTQIRDFNKNHHFDTKNPKNTHQTFCCFIHHSLSERKTVDFAYMELFCQSDIPIDEISKWASKWPMCGSEGYSLFPCKTKPELIFYNCRLLKLQIKPPSHSLVTDFSKNRIKDFIQILASS